MNYLLLACIPLTVMSMHELQYGLNEFQELHSALENAQSQANIQTIQQNAAHLRNALGMINNVLVETDLQPGIDLEGPVGTYHVLIADAATQLTDLGSDDDDIAHMLTYVHTADSEATVFQRTQAHVIEHVLRLRQETGRDILDFLRQYNDPTEKLAAKITFLELLADGLVKENNTGHARAYLHAILINGRTRPTDEQRQHVTALFEYLEGYGLIS